MNISVSPAASHVKCQLLLPSLNFSQTPHPKCLVCFKFSKTNYSVRCPKTASILEEVTNKETIF
jgi:hypothetical protein